MAIMLQQKFIFLIKKMYKKRKYRFFIIQEWREKEGNYLNKLIELVKVKQLLMEETKKKWIKEEEVHTIIPNV